MKTEMLRRMMFREMPHALVVLERSTSVATAALNASIFLTWAGDLDQEKFST